MHSALDNIGARRLYTILERILEDVSFNAPDKVCAAGCTLCTMTNACCVQVLEAQATGRPLRVTVDKEQVRSKMSDLLKKQDLSRFVL